MDAEPEINSKIARLFDVAAQDLEWHVQAVKGAEVGARDLLRIKPRHDGARIRVLDGQPACSLHLGPASKLDGHLRRLGEVQVSVGLEMDALGSLDEKVARRERGGDVS